MKKYFLFTILIFSFGLLFSTNVVTAATATTNVCTSTISVVTDFFDYFTCLVGGTILPLLVSAAVIFFIIGVIKYIANGDNQESRSQGRTFMMWGIVAIFVIVSVWGLVKILNVTFNIGAGASISTH